jgi:hypothetical protein
LCEKDIDKFITILAPQRHSLKSLTYIPATEQFSRTMRERKVRMASKDLCEFEYLEEVHIWSIGSLSLVHQLLLREGCAPPNLKHLHIHTDFLLLFDFSDDDEDLDVPDSTTDFDSLWQSAMSTLPSLQHLKLTVHPDPDNEVRIFNPHIELYGEVAAAAVFNAGDTLKQKGIGFTVYHAPDRTLYVPPILYGEREEPDKLIVSTEDDTWARGEEIFRAVLEIPDEDDTDGGYPGSGDDSSGDEEFEDGASDDDEQMDDSEDALSDAAEDLEDMTGHSDEEDMDDLE